MKVKTGQLSLALQLSPGILNSLTETLVCSECILKAQVLLSTGERDEGNDCAIKVLE